MTANFSDIPPAVAPGSERPAPGPGTGSAPATRPGAVRAVAVLAFVQAGFNAIGAFMGFQGAGQLAEFGLRRAAAGSSIGSTLTLLSLLALASVAVLVIGGLTVLKGKGVAVVAGAAVSILLSVWWAIEFDYVRQLQTMALMMTALPIVLLVLLFGTAARAWVRFDLPIGRTATPAGAGPLGPVAGGPASVAAPVPAGVPAGWHPDPTGRHQVRYWEGSAWTTHVADDGVAGHDPL